MPIKIYGMYHPYILASNLFLLNITAITDAKLAKTMEIPDIIENSLYLYFALSKVIKQKYPCTVIKYKNII